MTRPRAPARALFSAPALAAGPVCPSRLTSFGVADHPPSPAGRTGGQRTRDWSSPVSTDTGVGPRLRRTPARRGAGAHVGADRGTHNRGAGRLVNGASQGNQERG